jgi:hypothetical protein
MNSSGRCFYHPFALSDKVNPVRNSSGALNPAGIILKPNRAAEQQGIVSNGLELVRLLRRKTNGWSDRSFC